jgi:hypothetical protein
MLEAPEGVAASYKDICMFASGFVGGAVHHDRATQMGWTGIPNRCDSLASGNPWGLDHR